MFCLTFIDPLEYVFGSALRVLFIITALLISISYPIIFFVLYAGSVGQVRKKTSRKFNNQTIREGRVWHPAWYI